MLYQGVIDFWFKELESKDWWRKSIELDDQIKQRFLSTYTAVVAGEHSDWRQSDEGRLAEIIVLDQFSRNMFRDSAKAFLHDSMALALAQEAVQAGSHLRLQDKQRSFLLMPYMHSESAQIHEMAVQLFTEAGLEATLDFELRHKKIIDRFGRYPHRNAILGRESSQQELDFLQQPGSSF